MPSSRDLTGKAAPLEELPIVYLDDSDVDIADGFTDSDGLDLGVLNLSTISIGCNCSNCANCGC
jgi:hypothetical protein